MDARLLDLPLRRGEASALALAVSFGVGFVIAMLLALVIRFQGVENSDVVGWLWTVVGAGIGIIMGAVRRPTFINWALHRVGMAGGFVVAADLLLFVIGVLLAFVFYRYGILSDRPLVLIMLTGAFIASPIGMLVSNRLLKRPAS